VTKLPEGEGYILRQQRGLNQSAIRRQYLAG
jgi:hypothetical protein